MQQIVQFSFPTTVCFGPGALKGLSACLGELGVAKPLIVTDAGLAQTDIVSRVTKHLDEKNIAYAWFADVHPNPLVSDVDKAVACYKTEACDAVIALGGGSPIDAGKVVSVLASNPGPLTQYDIATGGNAQIKGPLAPVIAIPTTAGTGSEVGRCSVITDAAAGHKFLVCHPEMMPARAILDPELTLSLPRSLTAGTGMDALTHHIEALAVDMFHPMCDAIALKGIQLIAQNLERAVNQPDDMEARSNMMAAAMMGAVAFQKDLGAAHSLAHPLSTLCQVPHGLANAICIPVVMRYNLESCAAKYADIASCWGIDTHSMTEQEAAEQAIGAVLDLSRRIGIPTSLAEAGVRAEQLGPLAEQAFKDGCHLSNPRPCTKNDLLTLYTEAFGN
jgi:4-hydroxybutyrate dehydrogenase